MKRTATIAALAVMLTGCATPATPPDACRAALDSAAALAEVTAQIEAKIDPALQSAYRQDDAALEAFTSGLIPLRERAAALATTTAESVTECDGAGG